MYLLFRRKGMSLRKWYSDSIFGRMCGRWLFLLFILPMCAQPLWSLESVGEDNYIIESPDDAADLVVYNALSPATEGMPRDSVFSRTYDDFVYRSHERWLQLIPNLGTLQYAGNIGFCSVGLGWDYGKHDRWETHFLLGYLPRWHSKQWNLTFTIKENLVPWSLPLGRPRDLDNPDCLAHHRHFTFQPAVFTFFVNSIFDDEFWTEEPDRYPGSYYRFSSRIRFSIGVGQRISLHIPQEKRRHYDRISLFYEFSACDLHIISAVPHKRVTAGDILRLGIGMQYKFF